MIKMERFFMKNNGQYNSIKCKIIRMREQTNVCGLTKS